MPNAVRKRHLLSALHVAGTSSDHGMSRSVGSLFEFSERDRLGLDGAVAAFDPPAFHLDVDGDVGEVELPPPPYLGRRVVLRLPPSRGRVPEGETLGEVDRNDDRLRPIHLADRDGIDGDPLEVQKPFD